MRAAPLALLAVLGISLVPAHAGEARAGFQVRVAIAQRLQVALRGQDASITVAGSGAGKGYRLLRSPDQSPGTHERPVTLLIEL